MLRKNYFPSFHEFEFLIPLKNKTTTSHKIARMRTPYHMEANLHLQLITADRTIGGAGYLANFQANVPTASFIIFF